MELIRHIRACNDAVIPGARLPVRIAGQTVGWTLPATAAAAAAARGATDSRHGLDLQPDQIGPVARALAQAGLFRWRAEEFDVRADPDGPVLARIDRGALPAFGIGALGIHVNGLVGDRLWVARRSRDKTLDPGKLDHLVAGGVASGDDANSTVVKESAEEAGLTPELAASARQVARIAYAMDRPEGLRRDTLYCYDLELPADFRPVPTDGEVEAFELWPLDRVLDTVRRTDDFKFNVNLVLIDLFIRRGLVPDAEAAAILAASTREDPR